MKFPTLAFSFLATLFAQSVVSESIVTWEYVGCRGTALACENIKQEWCCMKHPKAQYTWKSIAIVGAPLGNYMWRKSKLTASDYIRSLYLTVFEASKCSYIKRSAQTSDVYTCLNTFDWRDRPFRGSSARWIPTGVQSIEGRDSEDNDDEAPQFDANDDIATSDEETGCKPMYPNRIILPSAGGEMGTFDAESRVGDEKYEVPEDEELASRAFEFVNNRDVEGLRAFLKGAGVKRHY